MAFFQLRKIMPPGRVVVQVSNFFYHATNHGKKMKALVSGQKLSHLYFASLLRAFIGYTAKLGHKIIRTVFGIDKDLT